MPVKALEEGGNEEGCSAEQIAGRIIRNIVDTPRYGHFSRQPVIVSQDHANM
jgi:hypothetical protein